MLAARDLIFSRSLDEVRVIDLTEAADVGKGTFFNYFQSKEQLLPPIVVLSLAGKLQDVLARARAGDDAWSALKTAMKTYFSPPVGDWRKYENNLLLAMVVDESVRREIAERIRSTDALYEEVIRIGQQQGAFRSDVPAPELKRVLRMFFHGLTIHFWMHDLPPTPPQVEEALNALEHALAPAVAEPQRIRNQEARRARFGKSLRRKR